MNHLAYSLFSEHQPHMFAMDREHDEIALVDKQGRVLFHAKHLPLNKDGSPNKAGSELLGIDLPPIETLSSYIESLFRGAHVIVYNKRYEMENAPSWFGLASQVTCVMERAAHTSGKWNYKYGKYEWVTLSKAIEIAGIPKPVDFPHRAVADARATMALWLHLEARDNNIVAQHFPERLPNIRSSARS